MTFPKKLQFLTTVRFHPVYNLLLNLQIVVVVLASWRWIVEQLIPAQAFWGACVRPHVHAHHEVIGIAVIAQEWVNSLMANKKAEDVDDTFFAFGDEI